MSDSGRPRLLDAHVHFWDPARPEWYQHLLPEVTIDYLGGDVTPMKIRYQSDTYHQDSVGWQVDGIVHVSAATNGRAYLAETTWLTEIAAQEVTPLVIIGAVDPALVPAEIEADLDEQMRSPLFRGVRVLEGLDYESERAHSVIQMLSERGLIFDLVTHLARWSRRPTHSRAFRRPSTSSSTRAGPGLIALTTLTILRCGRKRWARSARSGTTCTASSLDCR